MRKNNQNKLIKTISILSVFCLLVLPSMVQAASDTLSVSLCTQEHDNWCWAGTTQCIIKYHGQNPSQCDIANYAKNRSDCCGNTNFNWNHACNEGNSMSSGDREDTDSILQYWGHNTTYTTALSFSTAQTEIGNNRPFVMRILWSSGGGHVRVVHGWQETARRKKTVEYLKIMDPWPGEDFLVSKYDYCLSNRSYDWTHSMKVN